MLPAASAAARAWPKRVAAAVSVCLHLLAVIGLALLILPAPRPPHVAETEIAFVQSAAEPPGIAAPPPAALPLPPAPPPPATVTPALPAPPPPVTVARQQAAPPTAPAAHPAHPPSLRRLTARDPAVPPHPGAAHPAPRPRHDPAVAAPMPADHPADAPAARPAPPAADTAWVANFTARVQSAVQAAATYPMMARRAHLQGRVQVSFNYAQGAAADAAILVSSQTPALDRAALKAVASAAYPPAPAALGGGKIRLVVWVDFTLSPDG